MSEAFIDEKSFGEFRFEIWPNHDRLGKELLKLFHGETELEVDYRSLQVLQQLLSHNLNEIVLEEEFAEALWQGDVRRDSLDTHICELRKHLGDDFHEPRFIKTFRGKGYSFIHKWKQSRRPLPHESQRRTIPPVECSYLGTNRDALDYLMERYRSPNTASGRLIQFRDTHVRPKLPMPRPEDYAGMQAAFGEFLSHADPDSTVATMILGWHIDKAYVEAMRKAAQGHGENLKMFRLRHSGPLLNFIILDYEDYSEVLFGWGQGKPGTPGAVFKSREKRMVAEFSIFYDLLLDNCDPLDSAQKTRPTISFPATRQSKS